MKSLEISFFGTGFELCWSRKEFQLLELSILDPQVIDGILTWLTFVYINILGLSLSLYYTNQNKPGFFIYYNHSCVFRLPQG